MEKKPFLFTQKEFIQRIKLKIEKYHFDVNELSMLDEMIFELRNSSLERFKKIYDFILSDEKKVEKKNKYDVIELLDYLKIKDSEKQKLLLLFLTIGNENLNLICEIFCEKMTAKERAIRIPSKETILSAIKRMTIYFLIEDKIKKQKLWNEKKELFQQLKEKEKKGSVYKAKIMKKRDFKIPTLKEIAEVVGVKDPSKVRGIYNETRIMLEENKKVTIPDEYEKIIFKKTLLEIEREIEEISTPEKRFQTFKKPLYSEPE